MANKTQNLDEVRKQLKDSPVVTVDMEGYKEIKIDTSLLDDVDAFALIEEVQKNNSPVAMVDLMKILLGDDEYETMKAHYVKKEGRLKFSVLAGIYEKLFDALDPKA